MTPIMGLMGKDTSLKTALPFSMGMRLVRVSHMSQRGPILGRVVVVPMVSHCTSSSSTLMTSPGRASRTNSGPVAGFILL